MSADDYRAITRIYDAAIRPRSWTEALDQIVKILGGTAGVLVVQDPSDEIYKVNALSSAYTDLMASGKAQYYLETYARYEAAQWDFIGHMQIGTVARDEDMGIARSVLDQREDYVFLRKEARVLRRLASRLNDNQGWFDGLTIGFSPDVSYIPDATVAKLSSLLPHLAKSVEMGRAFSRLKFHYNAVLGVLDKVTMGLFLTRENGEVIVANREAERILSLEDGLTRTSSNHLTLRDATQTARLQLHISEISRTADGRADRPNRLLRVARPSLAHPFLVEVVPVRDANDELGENFSGALVIVVDPDCPFEFDIPVFGAFYSLTKAEAEVCDLLIRGFQTGEIAEMRGTRHATAKNQIAAVYQKTGTRRRGDLIRLVVKTLPPVI